MFGSRDIDIEIEYFWNDINDTLTINYTLFNNGVHVEYVYFEFGADMTTGGNNYYHDAEDLSLYTSAVNIHQREHVSGFVNINTGGIPVHSVGVIGIHLENPPDESYQ
jgi:hypothetical protein